MIFKFHPHHIKQNASPGEIPPRSHRLNSHNLATTHTPHTTLVFAEWYSRGQLFSEAKFLIWLREKSYNKLHNFLKNQSRCCIVWIDRSPATIDWIPHTLSSPPGPPQPHPLQGWSGRHLSTVITGWLQQRETTLRWKIGRLVALKMIWCFTEQHDEHWTCIISSLTARTLFEISLYPKNI